LNFGVSTSLVNVLQIPTKYIQTDRLDMLNKITDYFFYNKRFNKFSSLQLETTRPKKRQKENVFKFFIKITKKKPRLSKSPTKKYNAPTLNPIVIQHLKRLGGEYHHRSPRTYRGIRIPKGIQCFLNFQFPQDLIISNPELDLEQIEFKSEYDIKERNEYKFLREHRDAILIAEGDAMICALMCNEIQLEDDFYVYILDDEKKDSVEGPYLLSQFLEGCIIKLSM